MSQIKKHLYLDGECKLIEVDSELAESMIEKGWGFDRNTTSKAEEEDFIQLDEQNSLELITNIAKGVADGSLLYEELSEHDKSLFDRVQALWEKSQTKDEAGPIQTAKATLLEGEFPIFKKTALLEQVGVFENGDVLVQNQGDDSDRWKIPKETFEATYSKAGFDTDGDGEGDVDLNDLEMEKLFELAKENDLRVPSNIGRETLINKLMELQNA